MSLYIVTRATTGVRTSLYRLTVVGYTLKVSKAR